MLSSPLSNGLIFAKPSAAYAGTYTSGEIPVGVIATSDSLSQPGRFVPVAIIYPLAVQWGDAPSVYH